MKRIRTAMLLLTVLLLAGCSLKPAEIPFSAGNETEITAVVLEEPEETANMTESFSQPLKKQDAVETDGETSEDKQDEQHTKATEVSIRSDTDETKTDSSSQPVKDHNYDSIPDKTDSEEQDVALVSSEQDQEESKESETKSELAKEDPEAEDPVSEAEAETDTVVESEPEPVFDIDYWICYAKTVAAEKGLNLDSSATECWDDPIRANPDCIYLERDISARLSWYAGDEDITDVWIWYECIGENSYLIYIGYA